MTDTDAPSVFRLVLEVTDLESAVAFYTKLLGTPGRRQPGSRCYFTCGAVTLAVLEVAGAARPVPQSLSFSTSALESLHARAGELGALSAEPVHGEPGGEIAVRPWGERSFYVDDPWGHSLCFVGAGTAWVG